MAHLISINNKIVNLDAIILAEFDGGKLYIAYVGGCAREYDMVLHGAEANAAWRYILKSNVLSARLESE